MELQQQSAQRDLEASSSASLWFKSLLSASSSSWNPSVAVAVAVPLVVLGCFALTAEPAAAEASSSAIQPRFELAEEADFFSNVARYGRFFVTVMLGTVSVMTRPFANMFKNPVGTQHV